MSNLEVLDQVFKGDDSLGFNDTDSDKTDFTRSGQKELETKIERLTTLLVKVKKALEIQTNKTNEKVFFTKIYHL